MLNVLEHDVTSRLWTGGNRTLLWHFFQLIKNAPFVAYSNVSLRLSTATSTAWFSPQCQQNAHNYHTVTRKLITNILIVAIKKPHKRRKFSKSIQSQMYDIRKTKTSTPPIEQHTANLSCHLLPLRPNYHPQHLQLVLTPSIPRTMFLPQCDRPSFPPIQNNRQHHSSVLSESHHTADTRQDHVVLLQAVSTPVNLTTFPKDTFVAFVLSVCASCTQIERYNSRLRGRYAVPIHQC
jgi:hypothetical protein